MFPFIWSFVISNEISCSDAHLTSISSHQIFTCHAILQFQTTINTGSITYFEIVTPSPYHTINSVTGRRRQRFECYQTAHAPYRHQSSNKADRCKSKLHVAWASSQQRIRSRIFKETLYFRSKYRCMGAYRYVQMCHTGNRVGNQRVSESRCKRWWVCLLLLVSVADIINGFLVVEEA